jgi:hypothetical protein
LPAICVCITLCAILVHNFSDATAFIAVVFALKFFERIVSKAIEEPTYKNLYQLLSTEDRLAIQAKIDGGTKQLFIILGSLILLLYSHFMPPHHLKIGLLYISVPIFLFWLFSARQLVKAFKEKLRDILNPGNINSNAHHATPFDRLRVLFLNAQNNSQSVLLNLLGYKINLPPVKAEVFTAKPTTVYDAYVPTPFFNYLVPAPQHSRIEIELYKPLLIIQPKQSIPGTVEIKAFESLDDRDLLQMALLHEQPDEATIKALGKTLDGLKQDHEKKLILNILGRSDQPAATAILLNHLDYPDYYTKKQVFKTLETKNFKYTQKEELFYRSSLETVLSDITYIISVLNSIPVADDAFTDITNALAEEESILKNRLLSVLTWRYDKVSIMVIRENIFAGSSAAKNANNIMALELIDNLVDSEIKPKIMPVFETGSYSWRLSALNKWYNFPALALKDALVNILHYDYTKIGIWTKACALKILLDEKNKDHRQIVSGFSYHPSPLLRSMAHEYSETINGNSIYPLKPKDEFLTSTKNKSGNLKGMEAYQCLKLLKENFFLKKTSFNDLIRLLASVELKNLTGFQEIAPGAYKENKVLFILNGNVVLEYRNEFPNGIFSKHCITPHMLNENKLSKLFIRSQVSLYELSPLQLANLLLTSDSLMSDVLRNE